MQITHRGDCWRVNLQLHGTSKKHERLKLMEHWGIYVAFAWLATIVYAFADAVQAIRKGRYSKVTLWSHTATIS